MSTRLGRTSKILAAILGSLVASILVHVVLALWFGSSNIVPATMMTFLMLWVTFMVLVYWIEKPWKSWLMLLLVMIMCGLGIYFAKM